MPSIVDSFGVELSAARRANHPAGGAAAGFNPRRARDLVWIYLSRHGFSSEQISSLGPYFACSPGHIRKRLARLSRQEETCAE